MMLQQLIEACKYHPDLLDIPYDQLSLYISLICHLKPQIAFTQLTTHPGAPQPLPMAIHLFLQSALEMDDHTARLCWTTLKDLAWNDDDDAPCELTVLIPLFLVHGTSFELGK